MNKERLEMLAAHLEKLPREKFDMSQWSKCGCIGGHTEALWPGKWACETLDLTEEQDRALFIPDGYYRPDFATPRQAASVVRHLRDTGVVAWEKFL